MVLNRRFLRVAALGAVFALGLAGTALAATKAWTGGAADKNWATAGNWDAGVPGNGDVAVFPMDAEITTLGGGCHCR